MNTAEVREAEHALETLGWTEVFAYLCPGAITLMSLALWVKPNLEGIFGSELGKNEFVVALAFLLASYAAGLVVASWSALSAQFFLRFTWKLELRGRLFRLFLLPIWWLLGFFLWIPQPRFKGNKSLIDSMIRVQQELERCGFRSSNITLNMWGFSSYLATYRALVIGRLTGSVALLLKDAELVQRRRLFAFGSSFAFTLVALQALARIALLILREIPGFEFVRAWNKALPGDEPAWFCAIAILALLASLALRQVAGSNSIHEVHLTCSGLLSVPSGDQLNQGTPGTSKWRPVADALRDALLGPPRG